MQIKTQPEDIQDYLTDASNMVGGHAEKLFLPETLGELSQILREANEGKTPVTISGARTGTVGGAIPFGGVVVSLEKLNRIVSIDKEAKTAVVEPGVILGDLQKAVDAEGLFYPPDPTEWSCQIGGTVATNASGARSFKYGATREFVRRLTMVLADGDVAEIRRGETLADENGSITIKTTSGRSFTTKPLTYERPDVRKNVSGYFNEQPLDAIDLFIGSEGTLGVIAEIELSLVAKPEGFFSGIVFFGDESELLKFVDEAKSTSFEFRSANARTTPSVPIKASGLPPLLRKEGSFADASLIEYFDENALRFISEKFPDLPADAVGAIFFEQETTAENEDALLEQWNELLEKHRADLERSWFTTNEQDREKMRDFRHALPVSVNERVVKNKQRKVGTDMAVPDANFASFLRYYKETLNASALEYVIFGHIGDCHLHANMLPKDADEAEKARNIYGRCVAQAIMLGGTVSAEHGIGKLKRKYLAAMMGERYLNEMAELKAVFDPNYILGRGNMFDESYLNL
ncbi:MAG: FAD-binding oxidoreductase [Acidobacteria bacterium]|nr:FAD-binding oxidoreductase [Acidobacteriota bacterium]